MHKPLVAVAPILVLILQSTSGLAQSALCSNPQTVELVKQVYRQSLDKFVARLGAPASMATDIDRLVPVQVRSIRTVRIDQAVARHHCQASLEAKLTPLGAEMVNNPVFQAGLAQEPELRGFQIRGSLVTHPVRYTVQLTDDKKEIFVEASGQENMADLVFNVTGREVLERTTEAAKPESKGAPVRQAAAKPQEMDTVEKTGVCKGLDLSITIDHSNCLNRKFKAATEALNLVYEELMPKLNDRQKSALRDSQQAWVKSRESQCAKAGEEAKGGTLEGILIASCEVQWTENRLSSLRAFRPGGKIPNR